VTQPQRLSDLVGAPGAGFDEPFEMLEACHQRVRRMLTLLQRLRAHIAAHGSDAQARQAARDVLRYFDMAAPQHHLDEELHVFPPLLAQGDATVRALVERLQREHLEMESRWQQARRVLALVTDGAVERLEPDDEVRLESFAALYDAHLGNEEDIVFPAAQALVDAQARHAMGEEMSRRRGAKAPGSGEVR
jgi:hemerythrin-like domain-containing protein